MILVAGDFHDSGTMTAWNLLREGKSALEALEPAVRLVEANPEELTVGQGGYPNALGEVELDAGVMDGRTRASGAVGALKEFAHPVSVAYQVMTRLPHVLLVGEGRGALRPNWCRTCRAAHGRHAREVARVAQAVRI
ncbi:MAG: isoaspartyl peptidase/L-asparaginase [Chloroflexi bacterium]|nr:isoaspartyl peptidase/L-asparaginase [Chloroflexota bacterium]